MSYTRKIGRGRTSPLRRKRALATHNRKRRPTEWQRAYHSTARVEWVKAQRCVAFWHGCVGPIQNCHVVTGGMGRKADYTAIVPGCAHHHAEMHQGVQSFQRKYGIDLEAEAARVAALWEAQTA